MINLTINPQSAIL